MVNNPQTQPAESSLLQRVAGSDAELWPYENFDTVQMLDYFKAEADKIAYIQDPFFHPAIDEAQQLHIAEMQARLLHGFTRDRLERIQYNLMSLNDNDLTVQAVRLELAVHKLSNRGYDQIA